MHRQRCENTKPRTIHLNYKDQPSVQLKDMIQRPIGKLFGYDCHLRVDSMRNRKQKLRRKQVGRLRTRVETDLTSLQQAQEFTHVGKDISALSRFSVLILLHECRFGVKD